MGIAKGAARAQRHPDLTYQEILERDTRPVPEHLREAEVPDLGAAPIPISRYIDPSFARLEEQYLWPRLWQVACREEEIAQSGDLMLYDIAGRSLIVVRQENGAICAFHNSCLHRGRKLVTTERRKSEFRCPFHGMTWRLDGCFKFNPMAWDFPQVSGDTFSLPQAKVETWGGFVFVNMNPDAPPLRDIIGPLMDHFARYRLEESYIALHVQKKVRCNWKVAAEAFMESHHAIATHPQLLGYLSDVNSQYDMLNDYVTRQFSAGMVPSPFFNEPFDESDIVNAMLRAGARTRGSDGTEDIDVPEGSTARAVVADLTRTAIGVADGVDYSACSDAEMVDALLYNVFPNMSFWAGYAPKLFYRWRPNGRDHDSSIMDIYLLKRVPRGQPRPPPAPTFEIDLDESMIERGPEGGMSQGLALVFEQDMKNLPQVQEGMKSSATGVVHFGRYSEMRIRLMHRMIDKYIGAGSNSQMNINVI
jgi:phenylpropionate dioxygenase-like ring-hydroxylating dioxygenase large terminal subunit